MADEPIQPIIESSQAPTATAEVSSGTGTAVEPAPQTAAPVEAPASTAPTRPAEVAPAPSPEPAAPAEPAQPAEPAKPLSPLAQAAAELPKEEPKPEPEAPSEPVNYEFKLPEGVPVNQEALAAFTGMLAEHKLPAEHGQKLIDLHLAEIDRLRQQMAEHQQQVFDQTRETWRQQFEQDPELGGNRRQTTINTAVGFLRHFASDDAHFNRLIQAGEVTGWNDHPDFIRLLANAAKGLATLYREPSPIVPMSPAPQNTSRYSRRYGASGAR